LLKFAARLNPPTVWLNVSQLSGMMVRVDLRIGSPLDLWNHNDPQAYNLVQKKGGPAKTFSP
jgi:hypothetical protein